MKTGRGKPLMIKFSAPGKIHLLGEHSVVYGKPALLTTIDLRVTATITPVITRSKATKQSSSDKNPTQIATGRDFNPRNDKFQKLQETGESIVKKYLKLKTIPPYQLEISSLIPLGSGLGSSAAISAAYIAALLTFLKVKWDLNLINDLTFEAEKTFHGNPSGADNAAVIFGRLLWFRKESPDLKIIHPLPFTIPQKLAKNFVLINTGKPKETTKEMVESVSSKFKVQNAKFKKIFEDQEQLVKELLSVIQTDNGNQLIRIIRAGEKNLEKIGVVSPYVKSIIRAIEKAGGAAKICGGGGKIKATGILLCYHPKPLIIQNIAKSLNLNYFTTTLGTEGLKQE